MSTATEQPSTKPMQALLDRSGIPYKRIHCYGSQIMITCQSRNTAERWHAVLTKFCSTVRLGECLDDAKVNRGTVLRPTVVKVWRVWGTI